MFPLVCSFEYIYLKGHLLLSNISIFISIQTHLVPKIVEGNVVLFLYVFIAKLMLLLCSTGTTH